ncbi:MAG: hypothetical protein H6732_20335, partial [Alphaproteobacteria bacterium]|nr:hypothetical protein [Alphaproteobacteria bacterium]
MRVLLLLAVVGTMACRGLPASSLGASPPPSEASGAAPTAARQAHARARLAVARGEAEEAERQVAWVL